jgi:hypothetical protein
VEGGVAKEEMDQARSPSLAAFMEVRDSESMAGEHIPTIMRAFRYPPHPTFAAYSTTLGDTQRDAIFAAEGIIYMAESRPTWRGIPEEHRPTLRAYQSDLFCDLFGNLFRPVTISPAILTWNRRRGSPSRPNRLRREAAAGRHSRQQPARGSRGCSGGGRVYGRGHSWSSPWAWASCTRLLGD